MARHPRPALIGAFVVGAVALAIAGLILLGREPLLGRRVPVVAYFRTSVAGLDVGAPVRFRGVPIGSVTSIHAQWSDDVDTVLIPVELGLQADGIKAPGASDDDGRGSLGSRAFLAHMVELGLRAELKQESFVTNKLYVAFDFHPDTPIELVGERGLFEMPTVQTGLERLKSSLEQLPLEELAERSVAVLTALEELVGDPRIGSVLDDLAAFLDAAERLAREGEARLPELAGSATAAIDETRTVVRDTGSDVSAAAEELRESAALVGESIEPLSADAAAVLEELRTVAERLEALLAVDPNLPRRVSTLVDELTETARAVRVLAEYLERNPEALLRGRKNQ